MYFPLDSVATFLLVGALVYGNFNSFVILRLVGAEVTLPIAFEFTAKSQPQHFVDLLIRNYHKTLWCECSQQITTKSKEYFSLPVPDGHINFLVVRFLQDAHNFIGTVAGDRFIINFYNLISETNSRHCTRRIFANKCNEYALKVTEIR